MHHDITNKQETTRGNNLQTKNVKTDWQLQDVDWLLVLLCNGWMCNTRNTVKKKKGGGAKQQHCVYNLFVQHTGQLVQIKLKQAAEVIDDRHLDRHWQKHLPLTVFFKSVNASNPDARHDHTSQWQETVGQWFNLQLTCEPLMQWLLHTQKQNRPDVNEPIRCAWVLSNFNVYLTRYLEFLLAYCMVLLLAWDMQLFCNGSG